MKEFIKGNLSNGNLQWENILESKSLLDGRQVWKANHARYPSAGGVFIDTDG